MMQKYQDGDARRDPMAIRRQRKTRERIELRGRRNEEAKKAGYRSFGAMLFAQKMSNDGKPRPKHYWRSAQYKGHTRAREAKRLAERERRELAE